MKHLTETQLIDHLFEPQADSSTKQHLDHCANCREQFEVLQDGLSIARQSEPEPVAWKQPRSRPSLWKRVPLAAAAVLLVASLLGFRADYREGQFSVQFSLFPRSNVQSVSDQELQTQLAELEKRVAAALDYHTARTANELNEQFAALQESQYRDLVELSIQVKESLDNTELQTGKRIAMLNRNLEVLKRHTGADAQDGALQ